MVKRTDMEKGCSDCGHQMSSVAHAKACGRPAAADIPAYRINTHAEIMEVDRIIAAVNLAHGVLQRECSGSIEEVDGEELSSAWLTLQLVQEKLDDLRKRMEFAEPAEVTTHA